MKKLDYRPVARRTRRQREAEMWKKLIEEKERRKKEEVDLKSEGFVQRKNIGEVVVLDESDDDIEFIEDREQGEDMEGKEFISLDDDDEDDVGRKDDGLSAGDVKVEENDNDREYGEFISDVGQNFDGLSAGNIKVEENDNDRGYSRLILDSEKNEGVKESDDEIGYISEEESAELESSSDEEYEDYNDNCGTEDSEMESSESSDGVDGSSEDEFEVEEDQEEANAVMEVSKKDAFKVEEDEEEDDAVMEVSKKGEFEVEVDEEEEEDVAVKEISRKEEFEVGEEEEGDDAVKEVMSTKEEFAVEGDEEDDDAVKEVSRKEEVDDEEDESEVRLKRKKRKETEVLLVHGEKDGDDDGGSKDDSFHGVPKPNCVAIGKKQASRMHHTSEPHDDDDVTCLNDSRIHHGSKGTGSEKEKIGASDSSRKSSIKRKRKRVYKEDEVVAILADSIVDQAEAPFEKKPEPEKTEPVMKPVLPLKFTFGVEEPTPPEKSEEEKELEKLWAEFDMVLWSLNPNGNTTVEDEAEISPEVEADIATLCQQGEHHLILDEEIGIKCKYCSLVDLEIRYYVPPFSTDPSGRSERRDRATKQHDVLHGFNHQDYNSQPDSYPNDHEQGTVWDLVPGIGKGMHGHQREGFEFLWKNIAGGINLEALKGTTISSGGSGCIISHAPGTGKTRLAIVFIQTYMKLYPTCRPVIIAPRSMLLSWEAEFLKWGVDIPFHNLNKEKFSGKENKAAMDFLKGLKSGQCSSASVRLVKLYSWKKETSVLGISYGLFEKLAGEVKGKSKVHQKTEDDQVRNALLELPGLLVLDEGHTPRNKQSLIWKALSKVRTQRRIMLSGTPFQNNFDQLYNILYLVNPKFADEISSKHNRAFPKKHGLKENESRENWFSLTNPLGKSIDGGVEDGRLKEVRKLIQPFVHVHKGTILQEKLSGLRESLVILEPAGLQKRLLDGLQNMKKKQLNFSLDNWISSVSVHPSLLKETSETAELQADWDELERLRKNPHASVKTHFLMELIRLSESTKEKVLVFCQFLPPLNLVCKQLKSQFGWAEGQEILYMDGAVSATKRQSLINDFNDAQSISKVLLASTKACCEGINLVGASRVVLLDVVWNPSVETQAISRAYRLGQEKVVYVYHLVTSGEEEKYCRQVRKERLSELVFYSAENAGNEKKISSDISDDSKDKFLEAMVEHDRLKGMFKKIIYEPKDSSLVKSFGLTDL